MDSQKLKMPLQETTNTIFSGQNIPNNLLRTPTKSYRLPTEPVTPTANLKLLTDLASKEAVVVDLAFDDENEFFHHNDLQRPVSRKEKSLGLLCMKFLQRYPEFPFDNAQIEINLDEVSKDLNVERRRIYDIVNVLESVNIVSRCAKNLYAWLGKTNLKVTLAKLKAIAEHEKVENQVSLVKEMHSHRKLEDEAGKGGAVSKASPIPETKMNLSSLNVDDDDDAVININSRKEKSLGMMSRKFLMLFLVSKPQVVNLEMAACILIGESTIGDKKSTTYKTKIRRLYDIANILTSLNLIKKVHITEFGGRKPAFKYTGPNIEDFPVVDVAKELNRETESAKSLPLILGKRPYSSCTSRLKKAKLPRTRSENYVPNKETLEARLGTSTLVRHPSLQDVCQVAEEERRKLYSFAIPKTAAEKINQSVTGASEKPSSSSSTSSVYLVMGNGTSKLRELPPFISLAKKCDGSLIQLPLMLKINGPKTTGHLAGSKFETSKNCATSSRYSNDCHVSADLSVMDVHRNVNVTKETGESQLTRASVQIEEKRLGLLMNSNKTCEEATEIQRRYFMPANAAVNVVQPPNHSVPSSGLDTSSDAADIPTTPLKPDTQTLAVQHQSNGENSIQFVRSPVHLVLTPRQYTALLNSISSPSTSMPLSPSPFQYINSSASSPCQSVDLARQLTPTFTLESLSSSPISGLQSESDMEATRNPNKHTVVSRQLNMTR